MEPVKRQTAYICTINSLINGTYVRREGWEPNFISTSQGAVSRVQFAGVVIEKPSANDILVDDGTGSITIRRFEDIIEADIGQPVLIVGRPREYGGEVYIVSEVLKILPSPNWIKYFSWLRGEVEKFIPSVPKKKTVESVKYPLNDSVTSNSLPVELSEPEKEVESPLKNVAQNLINIIRELDPGDGAPTDEVLSKANIDGAEKKLQFLIEEGEVFELRAGKIKVLE